jgi:hypothetical protein
MFIHGCQISKANSIVLTVTNTRQLQIINPVIKPQNQQGFQTWCADLQKNYRKILRKIFVQYISLLPPQIKFTANTGPAKLWPKMAGFYQESLNTGTGKGIFGYYSFSPNTCVPLTTKEASSSVFSLTPPCQYFSAAPVLIAD